MGPVKSEKFEVMFVLLSVFEVLFYQACHLDGARNQYRGVPSAVAGTTTFPASLLVTFSPSTGLIG